MNDVIISAGIAAYLLSLVKLVHYVKSIKVSSPVEEKFFENYSNRIRQQALQSPYTFSSRTTKAGI